MDKNISNFSTEILSLPISALGLSPRIEGFLRRANLHVIQDLLEAQEKGLERIHFIGNDSAQQIRSILDAFIEKSKTLSTEKLEELRDPRPVLFSTQEIHNPSLITLITPFSKALLTRLNKTRNYEIIRRRYGLEGSQPYTLQEVGDYYGFTRENARQLEEKSLQYIRDGLFNDKYQWKIPELLSREAQEIRKLISVGDEVQTENEIQNRCSLNVSNKDINVFRFLLTLFNFNALPQRATGSIVEYHPAWIISDDVNQKSLYQASIYVHSLLLSSIKPISHFEITAQVNKRRKKKIETRYVSYALKLSSDIENVKDDLYQIKFEKLPSLANKAYRILFDSNQPLHFRDIWKEINHRLAKANLPAEAQIRSLTGQLADKKLTKGEIVNIAKSGYWKLKEWNDVREETIVELMKEFFHIRQSSAKSKEVYDYVSSKRDGVSEQSVFTIISSYKNVFIRVAAGQYELKAWGGKEYKASKSQNPKVRMIKTIKSIYTEKAVATMPYSQLVKEIAKRLELAESTVRNLVPNLSIVRLEKDINAKNYLAKVAVYTGIEHLDIGKQKTARTYKPRKQTLREKVQIAIMDYLKQQPENEALVADTAKFVEKYTGCKRQTFYRYLGEMDSVDKREIAKKLYCFIKPEIAPTPKFPKIDLIDEQKLRDNLLRATSNLTIENVDSGLFQLGKIFEGELKTYLQVVKDKNILSLTRKDIGRLVDMIDCVERNGIVKNKHHLNLLRQERNEHAHGEIPTEQERKRLMEQAPFLAGLFIDYITFFYEKKKEIL